VVAGDGNFVRKDGAFGGAFTNLLRIMKEIFILNECFSTLLRHKLQVNNSCFIMALLLDVMHNLPFS
jgi:hypothetical protein